MNKFIIKTFLFIIPLLILVIIAEVLLRHIPNEYSYKKEYLDKNAQDIETLILGSSHTYGGLNPKYFSSNTFNAGHNGQLFYYDKKIFDKYKNDLINLKTIIIPIGYPSFWGNYETMPVSAHTVDYIAYGFYTKSIKSSLNLFARNPIKNLRRFMNYYIKENSNIACTKLGWSTFFNSQLDLEKTAFSTLKWHTIENIKSEENNRIFKENVAILRSIIEWCQNNDVKVMLFTLPAYKTYRNNLSTEQWSITVNKASEIAEEFNNCIYLNLIADKNYLAKDFWDSSHLSTFGAEKLSHFMDSIVRVDIKARTHNILYK
mgnify:CR=1 FL=1